MLFSHVKISCFRAKAHLVFHWCLYNKNSYLWYDQGNYLNQTVLNWTQQKIEIRRLYVMWMHFLCSLCTLFVFAYWRGPNINWSILAGRCAFNLMEFFTAISFSDFTMKYLSWTETCLEVSAIRPVSQHLSTTRNRVCKRTKHVKPRAIMAFGKT